MFGNQCGETARGCACTVRGVCGKDPGTAGLQEVLIWACRGFAARSLAGCDGRQPEREYYTEFAQTLPKDTVILTAGRAKCRYNAMDLGSIGGIPRIIDAGQCNDSYSLVVIALQLAGAFGVGIDDCRPRTTSRGTSKRPCSCCSPCSAPEPGTSPSGRLPGFLSPGVLGVLAREVGLKRIATIGGDLARMVPAAAGG